jgi:serine/threonine protein kinase
MPYVQGESLRARLTKHGELPVSEAMRILREVASALAFAHDAGVVHRDINRTTCSSPAAPRWYRLRRGEGRDVVDGQWH